MNVFGELILGLIGTGFVWGVVLTSVFFLTLWLLIKLSEDD